MAGKRMEEEMKNTRIRGTRCVHSKLVKGRVGWEEGRDWLAHQLLGCRDSNKGSRRLEQAAGEGREQGRARGREDLARRLSGNLRKLHIQVG